MIELQNFSHRRYNPLTNEWVLVSPHRTKRPWQGKEEKAFQFVNNSYDASCYLCPGNIRADGSRNDVYQQTFVFTNDFSALVPEIQIIPDSEDDLLKAESEQGLCRVICFSPNHGLTLPLMSENEIQQVIKTWMNEYEELGKKDFINYVQIFENKGDVMGCSNPHPHGQIWASKNIPDEPLKEQVAQKTYFENHQRTLLADYLDKELRLKERIIIENDSFVALVPFWAVWPYETMIISRRAISRITEMDEVMVSDYSKILKELTVIYDNLFHTSFPYSAGIHQAPTDGEDHPEWHFHMHFYPPLLRSATIKKFMVGYEMMANPQRDITAELAAETLRALPRRHYSLDDGNK